MAVKGEIQKNPVGRPLKYKTVKAMQLAIDDYFTFCDNRTRDVFVEKLGETVVISNPAPYTMSGLARALGMSRQGLLDYANRDQFLDTIKDARARVEEYNENQLHEGRNAAGVIFNLKNNFAWVDQTQVDNTHKVYTPILGGLAKAIEDDTDALPADHND
jgi:hypothetical protein